jgi:hypothetical protein
MSEMNNEPSELQPEAIGYGKPPKATRFQKGKSGNPSGRPKGRGRPSLREALERHLDREVIARVGDKTVKMTLFEAMVVRVCSKGDLKTLQFVQSILSAPRSLEEMMAGRQPAEFTEEEAVKFRETLLEGVGYRHLGLESSSPDDGLVSGDGQQNR